MTPDFECDYKRGKAIVVNSRTAADKAIDLSKLSGEWELASEFWLWPDDPRFIYPQRSSE